MGCYSLLQGPSSAPSLGATAKGHKSHPLQYSCLENPMNSMKRQNDRVLKEELPRSVGAQYATGDQWRNNSRKNEGMEPNRPNPSGPAPTPRSWLGLPGAPPSLTVAPTGPNTERDARGVEGKGRARSRTSRPRGRPATEPKSFWPLSPPGAGRRPAWGAALPVYTAEEGRSRPDFIGSRWALNSNCIQERS